jgi:hypothetical protein
MNKIQIDFITAIKEKIRLAQYEALKAVNTHLINLYWILARVFRASKPKAGGNP